MATQALSGELRNRAGERLDYHFEASAHGDANTLVVIGHGVTANKDREWATVLSSSLAQAGVCSLRFSFAGNGDSEGDFQASCPTKEAQDLESVLDFVSARFHGRVLYAGHSMGGAVGVLVAARDKRLSGLISLAGMVHTEEFAQRKFGGQVPGASFMWEKPECPLSQEFLDDMSQVHSVLDLAKGIRTPWLLVHGTEDTVVPLVESEQIARVAPKATLEVLNGADHVFSENAEDMARLVVNWIQ
jgi:alpha/beta superfamily hydrolase